MYFLEEQVDLFESVIFTTNNEERRREKGKEKGKEKRREFTHFFTHSDDEGQCQKGFHSELRR